MMEQKTQKCETNQHIEDDGDGEALQTTSTSTQRQKTTNEHKTTVGYLYNCVVGKEFGDRIWYFLRLFFL